MRNKHIYGDEPHWIWGLVGTALAMVALSLLFAWIIERIA